MTVPQDGQPLTRRQLREMERSGQSAPSASQQGGFTAPADAPASSSGEESRRARNPEQPPAQAFVAPPAVEEELVVVATSATNASVSEEEAELAEVEDTPAQPHPPVTIDQNPSGPVLQPVFQPPSTPRTEPAQGQTAFDDLIASRGVGASNSISTTSALVLPNVPTHADVGSALDETGEVIITGSIDLPPSLGSTGVSPTAGLERSDLDALLEGADRDQPGSDVAPISAARAVSTHGSPTAMVAPPKRARVNAPLILAITAGVLAVGVVGLLLAAFVFRIF